MERESGHIVQVELQGCGVIYSNQSLEVGYYHYLISLISSANGTTAFFDNRDIAVANVTEQVIENKRNLGTYWAVDVVGNASPNILFRNHGKKMTANGGPTNVVIKDNDVRCFL